MADFAGKIRSLAYDLKNNKQALIKILSISVILLLAMILKIHDSRHSDIKVEASTDTAVETENPEGNSAELFVDISGAVERPGVYKVKSGTRLFEVIEMAGGLRSDADTNSVNQASFVEDGAKVVIPVAGMEQEISDFSYPSGLININTASKDQLKSLSGIGDVIADRIIEYRSVNRFVKKEDIKSVKGVGNSIYEEIEDYITV